MADEEVPVNAEQEAAIEAFRQAWTLVQAQRRFVSPAVEPMLDAALSAIATVATVAKENPA